MRTVPALVAFGLLTAGVAVADEQVQLMVAVGETVETEVGFAIGFNCDDNRIIRAEMRNKNEATNVFVVTGIEVGTTLCRAGSATPESRPSILFEIMVVPPTNPEPAPERP